MRLNFAQLAQHLPPKHHLYIIAGDEPLSTRESLDAIRANARTNGAQERASFTVDRYFNWQQISQFLQSFSLFAEKRILEINIPTGKPGVEGAKALEALASTPSADTTIIILLPELDRESSNSAWFQALSQHGAVVDIKQVTLTDLPDWIAQRLKLNKQHTEPSALEFIAQQVEGNLLAAHQEVQKLGLLYPEGALSLQQIQQSVMNVARFDVSQLGLTMLQGQTQRTARMIEGLKEEGETAIALMNPLIWLFRPMLNIKLILQQGGQVQSAMVQAKVFGDRQPIIKLGLDKLNIKQIEAALQKLAEIDRIAKGVATGDAWLELSRLCAGIAKIASKPPRNAPYTMANSRSMANSR